MEMSRNTLPVETHLKYIYIFIFLSITRFSSRLHLISVLVWLFYFFYLKKKRKVLLTTQEYNAQELVPTSLYLLLFHSSLLLKTHICKLHPVLSDCIARNNYSHTKQEQGATVLDIFNKLKPRYKRNQCTLHTTPVLHLLLSFNKLRETFQFQK